MRLYNTLTRQIEGVKPLNPPTVTVYTCGPTVYDHIHIGNLSAFIYADTLRRALALSGHTVKHVMNYTDVDDKTIARSKRRYPDLPPEQALKKLTDQYKKSFLSDMRAIGNDTAAVTFVSAVESVDIMQKLIKRLHDGGFAYLADDGIYFSIENYRRSGKKYGQLTEISENSAAKARVNSDEYDKTSAHDFALWKKQKANEPAWPFELNGQSIAGRPGWHIECSAMSVAALGQPFDIHSGGIDLIFPHHENEIAQSTAVGESQLANCFVHNEHLLVDGRKMSKSLNNFYTLTDIRRKNFDPLAFRLLVLQSHYRSQANFSWDNLTAAQNRLKRYRAMAALRWQTVETEAWLKQSVDPAEFKRALSDDLNTPAALAWLSQLAAQAEERLISGDEKQYFAGLLSVFDNALGLGLSAVEDVSPDIKQLLDQRQKARAEQDWSASDKLRDQLVKQGIGVRDTPGGQIWFRL